MNSIDFIIVKLTAGQTEASVIADFQSNNFYRIQNTSGQDIAIYQGKTKISNGSDVNAVMNTIRGFEQELNSLDTKINSTNSKIDKKQDILINGKNIKTINNQSILGKGNLVITTPAMKMEQSTGTKTDKPMSQNAITKELEKKQDTLVSGKNIKTINGASIVGEGDLIIAVDTEIDVDTEMSNVSENPVQNKIIKQYMDAQLETKFSKYLLSYQETLDDVKDAINGGQSNCYALNGSIFDIESLHQDNLQNNIFISKTYQVSIDASNNKFLICKKEKQEYLGAFDYLILFTSQIKIGDTFYVLDEDGLNRWYAGNEYLYSISTMVDNNLSFTSENPVQNKIISAELNKKQNTLTFDSEPKQNSENPITSNGIYEALSKKQNKYVLHTDDDFTSAGIYYDSNNNYISDLSLYIDKQINAEFKTTNGTLSLSDYSTKFFIFRQGWDEDININKYTVLLGNEIGLGDYISVVDGLNRCCVQTGSQLIFKTDVPSGNSIQADTSLSSISTNPVQNKVIYEALQGKQDKLTFDTAPTENSLNPVTSDGIFKECKNIREVAEGKTKTYILSYNDTFSNCDANAKWHDINGNTIIPNSGNYIDINCVNNVFNSQNTSIWLPTTVNKCVIFREYTKEKYSRISYIVVNFGDFANNFNRGDNIYIIETDVPDRWYAGGVQFYALETQKIDLNGYYTKAQVNNLLFYKHRATILITGTAMVNGEEQHQWIQLVGTYFSHNNLPEAELINNAEMGYNDHIEVQNVINRFTNLLDSGLAVNQAYIMGMQEGSGYVPIANAYLIALARATAYQNSNDWGRIWFRSPAWEENNNINVTAKFNLDENSYIISIKDEVIA